MDNRGANGVLRIPQWTSDGGQNEVWCIEGPRRSGKSFLLRELLVTLNQPVVCLDASVIGSEVHDMSEYVCTKPENQRECATNVVLVASGRTAFPKKSAVLKNAVFNGRHLKTSVVLIASARD